MTNNSTIKVMLMSSSENCHRFTRLVEHHQENTAPKMKPFLFPSMPIKRTVLQTVTTSFFPHERWWLKLANILSATVQTFTRTATRLHGPPGMNRYIPFETNIHSLIESSRKLQLSQSSSAHLQTTCMHTFAPSDIFAERSSPSTECFLEAVVSSLQKKE